MPHHQRCWLLWENAADSEAALEDDWLADFNRCGCEDERSIQRRVHSVHPTRVTGRAECSL